MVELWAMASTYQINENAEFSNFPHRLERPGEINYNIVEQMKILTTYCRV